MLLVMFNCLLMSQLCFHIQRIRLLWWKMWTESTACLNHDHIKSCCTIYVKFRILCTDIRRSFCCGLLSGSWWLVLLDLQYDITPADTIFLYGVSIFWLLVLIRLHFPERGVNVFEKIKYIKYISQWVFPFVR